MDTADVAQAGQNGAPRRRARRATYHAPWSAHRFFLGRDGLAAGTAALAVVAAALAAHLATSPRRLRAVAPRAIDETLEAVTFRTADGPTLQGWYLPHPGALAALVIAHGFAMSRHELLDLAEGLRDRGHAVLIFDFRGHGASEGRRSTIGYHEAGDVSAAVDFLAARPEVAGRPIGAAGLSMGGAATILAAARDRRIAAVAADSAFATLREVVLGGMRARYHPPQFPVAPLFIRFAEALARASIHAVRPLDAVAAVAPRPLLLIHTAGDWLIPVAHARALYAAAGAPKTLWIVPGEEHAAAFLHTRDEYVARLDRFFAAAWRETAGTPPIGASGQPSVAGSRAE